ncbi:MAG: sugar phosphate nucleotidyltransferase [Candidatus Bathyarchaeia archaeon]|nr:NTP transferase domain-containing protein [Candidatus Bathyarchaeota archaeon]
MYAVILAAGRGTRFFPHSKHTPKPLAKILSRPIIEYTIQALRKAGVKNIIIVIGHLGRLIKEHLGDGDKFGVKIQYCYNRHYALENATSLKAAEKKIPSDKPFLLLMGDHYFDEQIIEFVLNNAGYYPLLCVDRKPCYPPQIKDATRVLLNDSGYVIDIGKNIPVWNAIDTGLFILDNTIFRVIHFLEGVKTNLTVTDCIKYLTLNVRPVLGFNISGYLWFDIDTPQDIEFINSLLMRFTGCQ